MRRAKRKHIENGGWALLGGLLSIVAGALPEGSGANTGTALRQATFAHAGFRIEGDGFYVWDEDDRAAESWAIELAGPAYPARD